MRTSVAIAGFALLATLAAFSWQLCSHPPTVGALDGRSEVDRSPKERQGGNALTDARERPTPTPSRGKITPAPKNCLTVLDLDTGHPVAGAEVFWETKTRLDVGLSTRELEARRAADEETVVRLLGEVHHTDATGRIPAPRLLESKFIYARSGDKQGRLLLDPRQPPGPKGHRIWLRADFHQRVKIVDAHGEPAAGVHVWVAVQNQERSLQSYRRKLVTNAGGVAVFRHLHNDYEFAQQQAEGNLHLEAWYSIPGHVSDPTHLYRDGKRLVPGDLEWALPPTAELDIRITTHAGNLVPGRWHVAISVANTDVPRWRSETSDLGTLRIRHASLAPELTVHAAVGKQLLTGTIASPRLPERRVVTNLVLPEDLAILAGRATTADGTPIRNAYFYGPLQLEAREDAVTGVTDQEGKLLITLPIWVTGKQPKDLRLATLSDTLAQAGLMSRISFAAPVRAGRTELGDLVFAIPPTIASGRITGPGQPENLGLHVHAYAPNSGEWRPDLGLHVRHRDSGRFDVVGTSRATRFRLQFTVWTHARLAPIEFVRGQHDISVRLRHAGALMVAIDAGQTIPRNAVQLRLLPATGHPDHRPYHQPGALRMFVYDPTFSVPHTEDGRRMSFSTLAPGPHDLFVYLTGSQAPIQTIRGIEIVPNTYAEDPRIDPLDLRDACKVVTVQFDHSVGPHGGVFVEQPGKDPIEGVPVEGDRATLVLPPGKQNLLVLIPGYAPLRLPATAGEQRITLQRHATREVVARLAKGLPKLPAGTVLNLRLVDAQRESTRAFVRHSSIGGFDQGTLGELRGAPTVIGTFDAKGRTTVRVQSGASYAVHVERRTGIEVTRVPLARPIKLAGDRSAPLQIELR